MNEHDSDMQKRDNARMRLALAAIVLLGLGVRLFRLGADSIWYDEGVSLYLANLNIPALLAHTAGDIHPPLYYIVLHFWLTLAGHSQFAAAFFSLFFGILLIVSTFVVARRLLGGSVAVLAALLAALSPYHLWYSQEMRMYTLGALLGLLSFYFLMKALIVSHDQKPGNTERAFWISYIVCAALGLYTLYYFAFLLLFENLAALAWLVAQRRDVGHTGDASAKRWMAAQAAVLVLYLPWLPVAWQQVTQPPVPAWRGFASLSSIVGDSWAALSLGQSVAIGVVAPVLVLVGLLCAAALWERQGRRATLLLIGYTFVPVFLIYLISLWTPLFHVRYVFLYAPAFSIVLAQGLHVVRRHSAAVAVLAAAVILLTSARSAQSYFYDPGYAPDDHRSAVRWIADRIEPGDAVLINAGYAYPTFVYYFTGEVAWRGRLVDYVQQNLPTQPGAVVLQTGSIGGGPTLGWGSSTSDFYAITEAETAAALDEVARRHERIWVLRIYDTVTDPQGFIRSYLDDHFLRLDNAGFAGGSSPRVQLYRTYRTPLTTAPTVGQEVQANVGNQMRLVRYDVAGPLYPGESSPLTVYWQALATRPDLRAFISLVDESGREWAHWDDAPGGRLYATSLWAKNEVMRQMWRLTVPVGTPPGRYRLQAGLYAGGSGARLDVYDDAGRSLGAIVRLGEVQVGKARLNFDITTLPLQQRLSANLGGEVRLLGYSVSSRLAKPGESVELTAFWQGITAGGDERVVFVQLLDSSGKLWATAEGPPVAAWDAGEVLRDHYRLVLPADAPDGEMHVILGMYRSADKQRLVVERGLAGLLPGRRDSVDLGVVRVAGREHSFAVPAMQQQLAARLGEGAALLGYDLSPAGRPLALAPSESMRLTLYWQGVAPMATSYTVFVQLLGPDNRLGGQHDAVPGDGFLPTTSWVKDEILTDLHQITVRADAQPGTYRLVAGLYDAGSGVRLPVSAGGAPQPGDMIVLGTVTVR